MMEREEVEIKLKQIATAICQHMKRFDSFWAFKAGSPGPDDDRLIRLNFKP